MIDRDFTVAVFVVKDKKVLLVHHNKLKKWLPPGGHIEPNELPDEAAVREIKEETGLDIELLGGKSDSFHGVRGLQKPEIFQLEDIHPGHQHIDLIYAARPTGGEVNHDMREVGGARWFSLEDLKEVTEDIRESAKKVIERHG